MHHLDYKWNQNFPQIARDTGFIFRGAENGNSLIDWRIIGCLDIDLLMKENDFERLEQTIPHISAAPIGTLLKNSVLDPTVYKYFITAQLAIEYLLFCKQFLDRSVTGMRMALMENGNEIIKLQKILRKKDSEILNLHKKLQNKSPNCNYRNGQIYPCLKCSKNFNSPEMVRLHMVRKHRDDDNDNENNTTTNKDQHDDQNLINAIKLELEVKALKEKLNATEKELLDARKTQPNQKRTTLQTIDVIQREEKGIQTNFEVKEINDIEESFKTLIDNQKQIFDEWRSSENTKYEKELNEMRKKLNETLEEVKNYQKKIDEANSKLVAHRDLNQETDYWKSKFIELEKMHAENQNRLEEKLQNLEVAKFEKNDSNTFRETSSKPVQTSRIPVKTFAQNVKLPDKPIIDDDELSSTSSSSSSTSLSPVPEVKSKRNPIEINVVNSKDLDIVREKAKLAQQNKKIEQILSKTIQKPPPTPPSPLIPQKITRKDILKVLNTRLREIGINPESKVTLSSAEYSTALVNLTERRETIKSNYKTFFLNRETISNQIDQIVGEKLKTTIDDEPEMIAVPIPKPRMTSSSKPLKKQESLATSIEPVVNINTYDPPVAIHSISRTSPEQSFAIPSTSKQTIATPPSMYQLVEEDEQNSSLSEIAKEVLVQPKPVPRKRVIFDLGKIQEHNNGDASKVVEGKRDEDVSDWDISSFNSDMKA